MCVQAAVLDLENGQKIVSFRDKKISNRGFRQGRLFRTRNQCKDALQQDCWYAAAANFNKYGSYNDLNRSGRPMKTSPEII